MNWTEIKRLRRHSPEAIVQIEAGRAEAKRRHELEEAFREAEKFASDHK